MHGDLPPNDPVESLKSEGALNSAGCFMLSLQQVAAGYASFVRERTDLPFLWFLQAGCRWGLRQSVSDSDHHSRSLILHLHQPQKGLRAYFSNPGDFDRPVDIGWERVNRAVLAASTQASHVELQVGTETKRASLEMVRGQPGRVCQPEVDTFDQLRLKLTGLPKESWWRSLLPARSRPISHASLAPLLSFRPFMAKGAATRQYHDYRTQAWLVDPYRADSAENLGWRFPSRVGTFVSPGQPSTNLASQGSLVGWLEACPIKQDSSFRVIHLVPHNYEHEYLSPALADSSALISEEWDVDSSFHVFRARTVVHISSDSDGPGQLFPVHMGLTLQPLEIQPRGLTIWSACPIDLPTDLSGLALVQGDRAKQWVESLWLRMQERLQALGQDHPMQSGFFLRRTGLLRG